MLAVSLGLCLARIATRNVNKSLVVNPPRLVVWTKREHIEWKDRGTKKKAREVWKTATKRLVRYLNHCSEAWGPPWV